MKHMTTAERLEHLREHLREVENQLSAPEVSGDRKRMAGLAREHQRLEETIGAAQELAAAEKRRDEAREMLRTEKDSEMRELAELEAEEAEQAIPALAENLQLLLLPPDPLDERNLIVEIRAGTGGEEAALFAADLLRMYSRYCERHRWRMEMLSATESERGGFREVILSVEGHNAYRHLKHESGTHRVQRVPVTETQGRIHTSAATVAVLPEAEETDVDIRDADIRVDTMCASGPGGQGVNTTYSAIRLLHIPTGIIVTCQDERSQIKNKAKAMTVLRTRLLDVQREKDLAARSELRRGMVGSGDRSERIRTYNFPQNRVTDHRINLTLYNLDRIIDGELDELFGALRKAELERRMDELH